MPSNKKPRKKYIPKAIAFGYKQKEIEHISQIWQRVELATYISLPAGSATEDDILCIRDLFNVCLVGLCVRKDMERAKVEEARLEIKKAGDATYEIYERGKGSGHFIAKGDELRILNEMVKVCGDYVQQSLKRCPGEFMREWATLKYLQKTTPSDQLASISESRVRVVYHGMTPEKFRRVCCNDLSVAKYA